MVQIKGTKDFFFNLLYHFLCVMKTGRPIDYTAVYSTHYRCILNTTKIPAACLFEGLAYNSTLLWGLFQRNRVSLEGQECNSTMADLLSIIVSLIFFLFSRFLIWQLVLFQRFEIKTQEIKSRPHPVHCEPNLNYTKWFLLLSLWMKS